jgi:hypothetical protein
VYEVICCPRYFAAAFKSSHRRKAVPLFPLQQVFF